MIKLLLVLLTFLQPDSTIVSEDTMVVKSVVFVERDSTSMEAVRYQHIQGFFCDFEDRVNQNRKINLNIGVGDQ